MTKPPLNDWYWPLGGIGYEQEIRDLYPEEAMLLGSITILWNRQELALREIFAHLISSRQKAYALAIWDRQPTHKARRDILELALTTVKLPRHKVAKLKQLLESTKTLADARNRLTHAEYVSHGRTGYLHAKVSTPRSTKLATFEKVTANDLRGTLSRLAHLLRETEAATLDFGPPKLQRLRRRLGQL